MDKELVAKERRLEVLEIDSQIADREMEIAQKKAVERQMKKTHGKDWKKIFGIVGSLKPNSEALHSVYAVNPELRDLSIPKAPRRR